MVQAEVADRLAAGPGSRTYGVPSVKARWYADVRRAGAVGRTVFWPVPNVDSGLVALHRRDPPDTSATRAEVFAVVDAAFAQRRKTLRAALAGWAGVRRAAEQALRAAGVDPSVRGEQLDVAEFARIAERAPPDRSSTRRCIRMAAMAANPYATAAGAGAAPPRVVAVSRPMAARPVTVRVPAKVNLQLSVGATPARRLPRPRHRVPGRRALRRGHRRALARPAISVTVAGEGAGAACPSTGATSPSARSARSPSAPASPPTSSCICARRSRSPAAWPAAAPTRPRPWSPATRCGARTSTRDELADARRRASAPTSRSRCVGGTAVGVGTGTRLTPALARGRFHWVFALADAGLSTPEVYAELDRLALEHVPPGAADVRPADGRAARRRRRRSSGAALANDLQRAAAGRCARGCGSPSTSARSTARSGRSSPAPGRPARSSPATTSTRSTSRSRCRRRVSAGPSGAPTGPVHGARVVEAPTPMAR